MTTMSEDAKAIVLLCGRLGDRAVAEPLRPAEYTGLVHWMVAENLRPADLLDAETAARTADGAGLDERRLAALLARGVQLGFAVERWNQSGLWVLCRSDPDYPVRLKAHLRDDAPPILWGAGERALLVGGGLAVVGSRDVDDSGREFAREVAAWCARGGLPVVSGGARGVDQVAMSAALESGGVVTAVPADSLLRQSVVREARDALADGRLLLLSPHHPEARFTVGTAMGRNKVVYAMADFGLVVSTQHGQGCTWAGAKEELGREDRRPVFVRLAGPVPPGNDRLIGLGAVAFPAWTADDDPEALLRRHATSPARSAGRQASLFGLTTGEPGGAEQVSEPPTADALAAASASETEQAGAPATVYDAVLPLLLAELDDALSLDELAGRVDVTTAQLRAWLTRAEEERLVRKLTRPVRYIRRTR